MHMQCFVLHHGLGSHKGGNQARWEMVTMGGVADLTEGKTNLCALMHWFNRRGEPQKPGQEGVEHGLGLSIEPADIGERLLEVSCSQRLRRLHAGTLAAACGARPCAAVLVRRQTPQQQ